MYDRSAVKRVLVRACVAVLAGAGAASACPEGETRLLMIEQAGCEYCEAWDEEIGRAYPLTEEGGRAPLIRASIAEPLPEGITAARRIGYTPTFLLLCEGRETGRIEGYPGPDFFYPMLQRLLADQTRGAGG